MYSRISNDFNFKNCHAFDLLNLLIKVWNEREKGFYINKNEILKELPINSITLIRALKELKDNKIITFVTAYDFKELTYFINFNENFLLNYIVNDELED